MMLQQGVPPGLLVNSNSGDAAAVAAAQQAAAAARESGGGGGELGGGGGGSFSEEERGRMEEGERNNSGGGNRWPRQETLALLKIRSDMDVAFRDSSLKGPLWDEVSRKLAELGYHRSAKKCKEKFENVYKYHKRTKEGRTSKADGKTYRFFDQLEALDTHPPPTPTPTPVSSHHPLSLPAPPQPQQAVAPMTAAVTAAMPVVSQVVTVPSVNPMVTMSSNNVNPISMAATAQVPATVSQPAMNINHHQGGVHFGHQNVSGSILSNSTSSSTSSDEEPPERSRKRKRKWKDFFGRLMKEVIDKQEELQMKFLDTLEKRERERTIREEAWRVQEMAKMNREHDLLVQERSIAAAKDAAVISFLQKITEQQNAQNPNATTPQLPIQIQVQENPRPAAPPAAAPVPVIQKQPPLPPVQAPQAQPQPQPQPPPLAAVSLPITLPVPVPIPVSLPPAAMSTPTLIITKTDNGGSGDNNMLSPSPSRWPKAEVQALIKLRTTLDMKYQENGPKGPLWEEISSSMRKLGYNRNAKRCKEKWENINKYYKKVKESSKKRPEDSKTCPYFHQLDAIYRDKAKTDGPFNSAGFAIKPENQMAPIMARPEQQWPLPQDQQQQQQQRIDQSAMDVDHESENHDEDDEDDDEEDEDEDEGAHGYEIVTNKASSMASIE